MGFGLAWYFGFNTYAARRTCNEGVVFQVEREPIIENDPEPDGPPVQTHETVYLAWVDREYTRDGASEVARAERKLLIPCSRSFYPRLPILQDSHL